MAAGVYTWVNYKDLYEYLCQEPNIATAKFANVNMKSSTRFVEPIPGSEDTEFIEVNLS